MKQMIYLKCKSFNPHHPAYPIPTSSLLVALTLLHLHLHLFHSTYFVEWHLISWAWNHHPCAAPLRGAASWHMALSFGYGCKAGCPNCIQVEDVVDLSAFYKKGRLADCVLLHWPFKTGFLYVFMHGTPSFLAHLERSSGELMEWCVIRPSVRPQIPANSALKLHIWFWWNFTTAFITLYVPTFVHGI